MMRNRPAEVTVLLGVGGPVSCPSACDGGGTTAGQEGRALSGSVGAQGEYASGE